MSRSGYSDDCDDEMPLALYRQAVHRATTGYRGQHLLRKLRDALDAMPHKQLITGAIKDDTGAVCALGALDPNAPAYDPDELDDWEYSLKLAKHFGVAHALASEIVFINDEAMSWRDDETPEQRWTRMREWVDEQIVHEKPESVDAVDPHDR